MSVNPDVVAAFFAGISAVLSSVWSLRSARKRAERDCAQRISEIRQAIQEGVHMERERNQ